MRTILTVILILGLTAAVEASSLFDNCGDSISKLQQLTASICNYREKMISAVDNYEVLKIRLSLCKGRKNPNCIDEVNKTFEAVEIYQKYNRKLMWDLAQLQKLITYLQEQCKHDADETVKDMMDAADVYKNVK